MLLGCNDVGWEAISEFSENDWIADVIAIKGKNRIAFEIQWSNQTYEKTKERQTKYKKDNIRCCWFFKKPPKEFDRWGDSLIADKNIPLFKIYESEKKDILVNHYEKVFPIREFVKSLLEGQIKFCENLVSKRNQKIKISFIEIECWKCKTKQNIYFIQDCLESRCGKSIRFDDEMWNDNALKYHPKILKEVNEFLKTEKGKKVIIGEIKKRYSRTTKSYYKSFGCCNCDAIFGDWYLQTEILEAKYNENNLSIFVDIQIPTKKEKQSHWCYSKTKDFCE